MKRTLLMLLELLMVFSVISCHGNTSKSHTHIESTVDVKVDVKTAKSIKEIEQYGNLYAVIISDNETEFNFVNLKRISKQETSLVEPVKFTSDNTDIYVYLIAVDENENHQDKVQNDIHNEVITIVDVNVSIIPESGKVISHNEKFEIYVGEVVFISKNGEPPNKENKIKMINSTDIFLAENEKVRHRSVSMMKHIKTK